MIKYVSSIFHDISTNLQVVERSFGVVQRITRSVQTATGTKRETLLISCQSETACTNGRYTPATPDDAVTGISYVEQRGGAVQSNISSFGYNLTYPIRFVVWLNAGKINQSACGDLAAHTETLAMNCMRAERTLTLPFMSKPVKATINVVQSVQQQPGLIFAGLEYEQRMELYLHPFAYFAIDCNVVLLIPANCTTALPDYTPVTCITY